MSDSGWTGTYLSAFKRHAKICNSIGMAPISRSQPGDRSWQVWSMHSEKLGVLLKRFIPTYRSD